MILTLVPLLLVLVFCGIIVIAGLGELVHTRIFQNEEFTGITDQRAHIVDGIVLLSLILFFVFLLLFQSRTTL